MEIFTLAQLDPTHHLMVAVAIEAAQKWTAYRKAGNFLASLVLMSAASPSDQDATGYGTGKTHIATACFHTDLYCVQNSYTDEWEPYCPAGKFYEADKLIQAAGHDFDLDMRAGRILVIDDVGTEAKIPYVAADSQADEIIKRYTKIIDYCYTKREKRLGEPDVHGISIIMTSNMRKHELQKHIGGRAWSRLQQMAGPGCIVDMTGTPDYRLKLRGDGRG